MIERIIIKKISKSLSYFIVQEHKWNDYKGHDTDRNLLFKILVPVHYVIGWHEMALHITVYRLSCPKKFLGRQKCYFFHVKSKLIGSRDADIIEHLHGTSNF